MEILKKNEQETNRIVAQLMRVSSMILAFVYILDLMDIFVIDLKVMTVVCALGMVLLWIPTLIINVCKVNHPSVKYICVTCAAAILTCLVVSLTYHTSILYVYAIALAALYLSGRVLIYAAVLTAVTTSLGQILALHVRILPDGNFLNVHDVVIYSIVPRLLALFALTTILWVITTRAAGMLRSLSDATDELTDYYKEMMLSFAALIESRDEATGGHVRRTAKYVELICEEMRRRGVYEDILTDDYVRDLVDAAPMHDIGKIAVPDSILRKPAKLTAEEFEIIKQHSETGREMIGAVFQNFGHPGYCEMACEVAMHHHERWNGHGYPSGLVADDIPVCARIMAVADVFDAVSVRRCYREASPMDECFAIIEEGSGVDFDPKVVEAFLGVRDAIEEVHAQFIRELEEQPVRCSREGCACGGKLEQ